MGIAYTVEPWCPSARRQGASSADRPTAAFITAVASYLKTGELWGHLRRASEEERRQWIMDELANHNLRLDQMTNWVRAVNGMKAPPLAGNCSEINGMKLDNYQRTAASLLTYSGGVLSLGCGLGKTLTATAAAKNFVVNRIASNKKCWIVCPLNAIPAWQSVTTFLETIFDDVKVLSMDSLHKHTGVMNNGGVVIYDEVHLLGTMKARRTKAAHKVRYAFDVGLCLTGTLLHGGVEKALSVQDLAVPGLALFATSWTAGDYFNCLVKKDLGGRSVTALEKPTKENFENFQTYISRGVVAMSKDSPTVRAEMDLPPQTIQSVDVCTPWDPIEYDIAEYAEGYFDVHGEFPSMQHVAHALCRTGAEEKLAWLSGQLAGNDEPLVVFAQYRESLDAISQRLTDDGISFVRVDGDVVGAARTACRDRFQSGEVRVFVGQAVASSTSMDLFYAFRSVMFDHPWSAAAYDQCLARTCRRGQKHDCEHYDLIANNLQSIVVKRLREAQAFDASVEAWQRGLTTLKGLAPCQ